MQAFYSPLRYPGGKGKIAEYIKDIYRENLLYDGVYIEPYAGGASVALSLLFNQYASSIIINDLDKSIHSFWKSVLKAPEKLCKKISDTKITVKTWEKQKYTQKNKKEFDYLDLGFSTFFLNRTNRSGILSAGIIGGKNQNGSYKIDARFNKKELINRITKIAEYKNQIKLYNKDAVKLIEYLKPKLDKNSLFYFDPPYYVKGKQLYLNYYNDEDHIEIANSISNIDNQRWIVTYDNVPFISTKYKSYRKFSFSLNYHVASAKKGEELMIFSDSLYIPKTSNIKKIKTYH